MKKFILKSLGIIPFAAIILVIFELIVSNELASYGGRILSLDTSIESMQQENDTLEAHIASSSALSVIQVKAFAQGFTQPTSVLSIGPVEVALHQSRP